MRRFVVAAVVFLTLAVPTAAFAKTVTHAFTIAKGPGHGRGSSCTSPTGGGYRSSCAIRGSTTRRPTSSSTCVQQGDPDGNIVLDTGGRGMGCAKAGDSYVCSLYLPGLAAGNWFVTVAKETTAAVPVHLRLAWPAT